MNPSDTESLNHLFNTALAAPLPYHAHQASHRAATHLEARLKKLAEMEAECGSREPGGSVATTAAPPAGSE